MKMIKQNIEAIIVFIYMVAGSLFYNPEELLIPPFCLLFLLMIWFWRQIIKNRISFTFDIRKYPTDVKIIGALFLLGFITFISNTFFSELDNRINNWCILVFLFCFIYVYVYKNKEKLLGLMDGVIYAGIIILGIMLFAYAGNENGIEWIANLISDKAVVASWALLVSIAGVMSYCICEDKVKSWFYLLATTMSFLILCINHYCISFWVLLIVFFLIPILLRPMAELIKRDMQMLFLFLFLLSNLSLVTNYTEFLLVDVELSLESGVYLEMLIAVGAIVFFHFWDKLPDDADLTKTSMLKLQRVFAHALGLVVLTFVGIIFGGNSWYEMPDTMMGKLIKSAAIPVLREVEQSRSGLSLMMEYGGIVGTFLLLVLFYRILAKMMGNQHMDKPVTTSCVVIGVIFLVQLLLFMPSINAVPVYYMFFLCSAFTIEEKKKYLL